MGGCISALARAAQSEAAGKCSALPFPDKMRYVGALCVFYILQARMMRGGQERCFLFWMCPSDAGAEGLDSVVLIHMMIYLLPIATPETRHLVAWYSITSKVTWNSAISACSISGQWPLDHLAVEFFFPVSTSGDWTMRGSRCIVVLPDKAYV